MCEFVSRNFITHLENEVELISFYEFLSGFSFCSPVNHCHHNAVDITHHSTPFGVIRAGSDGVHLDCHHLQKYGGVPHLR